MEYDRSKDPMLAMDYATPNYDREIEALRKERDDRLSDAKHYFEWLGEVQAKLDACKQELASTKANDREYITVLEDRANKYSDQLTRYRAVMEQALYVLEDLFGKDNVDVKSINALREVLREE